MATKTPNFNLVKPDLTDFADIRVLNSNMDIIDTQLKEIKDSTGGGTTDPNQYALKSDLENYVQKTGGNITGVLTINEKQIKIIDSSWKSEDGTQYWIKYADGELFQSTTVDNPADTGRKGFTITLPAPFIDTNYFVGLTLETHGNRHPNSNVYSYQSIVGADSTLTATGFTPKTTTTVSVVLDSLSLGRVFMVGRWK